jgi:multidrug resistance efflux pump
LVARKVMAAEALKIVQDDADAAQADVNRNQYELDQTVAYAPADGYVINMQLRAGQFARLKAPVVEPGHPCLSMEPGHPCLSGS